MMNKKISPFYFLLALSSCKEDEKILQVLKEINHRHDHQYAMQLLLKKYDNELNEALTIGEKREVLEYRNLERARDISRLKREIIDHLNDLRKINSKDFTGKISTNIRSYAIEKSDDDSFIKMLFIKLPLWLITSGKNNTNIELFQWHVKYIVYSRVQLWELENFPAYCMPALEDSIRETSPSIKYMKKINDDTIADLIKKYSK